MTDHRQAEQWLLLMGEIGRRISDALSRATSDADLVNNSVMVVLCTLDLDGPARPGRLADITGLSTAGMTGLLDRLESKGLVSRSAGAPGDRRGVVVRLTPTGRRTIRRLSRAAAAEIDQVRLFSKSLAAELDDRASKPSPE